MWHSFVAEDNADRDNPCIDWLQDAIDLANHIVAVILEGSGNGDQVSTDRGQMASILRRDAGNNGGRVYSY